MKVLTHEEAKIESTKISEYYRRRDPQLSRRFIAAFRACVDEILLFPEAGSPAHPIGVRKRRIADFPYQVFYLTEPDGIYIIALAHHSQEPNHWLERITEV
jgi:toxin ParE1/3/4